MAFGTPALEENTLISRSQKGDRDAFGELVDRYRLPVINVVYRMCGDAALAEDAAQTAFLKAWQHLNRFQLSTSFRAWIYRIAMNTALDNLRREKPDLPLEQAERVPVNNGIEHHVEQSERRRKIQQAVLALPEGCRAAVILREYEGLSYKEISDTLEISLGTVMSRLNYGRTLLQQRLQAFLEER